MTKLIINNGVTKPITAGSRDGNLELVFLVCGYVPQVKMGLTGVIEVIWDEDGWERGQGGMKNVEKRPTSGSYQKG